MKCTPEILNMLAKLFPNMLVQELICLLQFYI